MNNPVVTGNVAIDMIYACMNHYKKFGKRVKSVTLSHKYWTAFERFIKDEQPELEFTDAIQFNNVLIQKGSHFQHENLIPELYKVDAIMN